MKGLHIDDTTEYPARFTKVFGSVLEAFAPHYWYIDGYGPFSITDKPNFSELDSELDRLSVEIEGCEYGPLGLWRPGILPWAADLLVVDEGTTLIGILGDERNAAATAQEIRKQLSVFSPLFFELIEKKADVALLYIDGWWEVYSANPRIMAQVACIQGAYETDS